MNNFSHIIIVLSISLVIFVSGCVSGSVKVWPPKSVSDCENFDKVRDSSFRHSRDDCYEYFAYQNSAAALCDKIENVFGTNLCKANVAAKTNNIELCKSLPTSTDSQTGEPLSYKDYCLDGIITIAQRDNITLNISICEFYDFESGKTRCRGLLSK